MRERRVWEANTARSLSAVAEQIASGGLDSRLIRNASCTEQEHAWSSAAAIRNGRLLGMRRQPIDYVSSRGSGLNELVAEAVSKLQVSQ
jgi:hypothetical protein